MEKPNGKEVVEPSVPGIQIFILIFYSLGAWIILSAAGHPGKVHYNN